MTLQKAEIYEAEIYTLALQVLKAALMALSKNFADTNAQAAVHAAMTVIATLGERE